MVQRHLPLQRCARSPRRRALRRRQQPGRLSQIARQQGVHLVVRAATDGLGIGRGHDFVRNGYAAARLLPASKGAEKARVTDIAAWTLLAKVYLTFGKPGEAKTALEEAMKNPNYGLVNTTADAFNVKNKFNKEIIFALYYNKANDTGHGYWYSTTKPEEAQLTQPAPVFRALYDARDNRLPLISEYTEDKKGTTTSA